MSLRPVDSQRPKCSEKRTSSDSSSDWRRKIITGDFCQRALSSSMASGLLTRSETWLWISTAKSLCRGDVRSWVMICSLGFHLSGVDDVCVVAPLLAQPRIEFHRVHDGGLL